MSIAAPFAKIHVRLMLSCATAALFAISTDASAQSTTFTASTGTIGSAAVSDRGTVAVTAQELTDEVISSIVNGNLSQTSSGSVGDSVVEITANSLLATARGNVGDTEGQLLGDAGDGRLGFLTAQIASEQVRANINDSSIEVGLISVDDADSSSFVATGNRIDARATVNEARTVFADDISANLVGLLGSDTTTITTASLERGDFDTQLVDVEGGSSVVASSQVVTGGALSSTSTVNSTEISIDLTASATNSDARTSALTVEANDLRSTLIGNTAFAATDLIVDTAYSGTGVVLNQQQIGNGTEIALFADTIGNSLSASLSDQTDSSVSVSENVVGASVSGNIAREGAMAGTSLLVDANQITSAGGEARVDFSTSDQLSLGGAFVAGTQQQIDGDGVDSSIEGITNGTELTVSSENVAQSSMTLDQNTLFALAKGNDAETDIALTGTNIDASAALGNQQSIVDTSVIAGTSPVADAPSVLAANIAGTLTESSSSIDENAFVGRAEGNIAINRLSAVSDTALTRTSPNNRAALFTTDADARGGFVLGSNQSFDGTNNTLRSVIDTDLQVVIGTATAIGNISSSNISINANEQSSVSMVNQAENELELSAASLGVGTEAISSIISSLQDVNVNVVSALSTLDTVLDQENYTTGINALSIADSSLSIDDNQNRSTVIGNEATNRLVAASQTEIVGNLVNESRANLTEPFSIRATSVLATEQTLTASTLDSDAVTNSTLEAKNGFGEVGIVNSSLSIKNNVTAAFSTANSGVSDISQTAGTRSGATAALRNVQVADVANTNADANVQLTMDTAGTGTNTSFEVDNNQIFVSGRGNTGENNISASISTFEGPADSIAYNAFFDAAQGALGQARADFALLSDQDQTGSIDSTANVDAQLRVRPTASNGGFLVDSTASINSTFARAVAQANEVVNTVGIDAASQATNLTGAIASRQQSDGAITATARTEGINDQLVMSVRRGLVDSSMSIDENIFVASADANTATNRLSIEAASLSGATLEADFNLLGARLDAGDDLASARSDASIANLQETAATPITAVADFDALMVTLDFDLERSAASINDNIVRSSAQANGAVNIAEILADTEATVTGAVANVQTNLAAIDVDAVFNGVIGVATNQADGNSGLDESAATLENNITLATASGNSSTSVMQIDASKIEGLSANSETAFVSQPVPSFTVSRVQADNVVASQQVADGAITTTADSRSSASIRGDIDLSSVSLSGNIGQSASVANEAINGVRLQASTSSAGTSAVSNEQVGNAGIEAATEVDVVLRQNIEDTAGTPEITSTAVTMNDNLAISGSQGNIATNTLSISGASVTGRGTATNLTVSDGEITGTAANTSDNILASDQNRSGGTTIASSAAILSIALQDSDDGTGTTVDTPSSLTDTSLSMTGNIGDSTATANRVDNSVALNGLTKLDASAGVVSTQANDNTVTADVQLTSRIGTDSLGNISGTTVALNGNIGVARANGNDAVNRVSGLSSTTVTSVGITGGSATLAVGTGTVLNASADFSIINNQSNSGAVTAQASSAVLPTTSSFTTGGTVLNSSLSLSSNALIADASSNRSVNQLTVSGRAPSENITTAIANRQIASGAVASRVDSFRISSVTGGLSGSSVRLGGNQVSASANGNNGRISSVRE